MRVWFTLVGGPFDGAPGLGWQSGAGSDEPAEQIYVGCCPGRGVCRMMRCVRAHVAYWKLEELMDAPVQTTPYVRVALDVDERSARYVHGDIDLHSYVDASSREVVAA